MLRGFDLSSRVAELSNCISFLTSFDLTSEAQRADVGHFVVLQRVDVGQFVVLQRVDIGPFVVFQRVDVGQFVVLQRVDGPFVVLQRVDVGQFVVLQGVDVGQFVVLQEVDVGQFVVLERVDQPFVVLQRVDVGHFVVLLGVDDGHLLVLVLPVDSSSSIFCAGRRQCSTIKKWCSVSLSLGPRPKTNPSMDHFQYCAQGRKCTLYWKRYTRWMRSGDKTNYNYTTCFSHPCYQGFPLSSPLLLTASMHK